MRSENKLYRAAAWVFIIIAAAAGLMFFYKLLLIPLLPFMFGWLIAALLKRPIDFLSHRTRAPRKLISAVIVLLAAAAAIAVAILFIGGLFSALTKVYDFLTENLSPLAEKAESLFDSLSEQIGKTGLFGSAADGVRESFSEYLTTLGQNILSKIGEWIAGAASAIPGIIIFSLVFVISAFYFTSDFSVINGFFRRVIPEKARPVAFAVKRQFILILGQFFKAYSVLMLLSFAELYLGLTVIGVEAAFTCALLISVIDILPILGVGTVLIPWGVLELICGDTARGLWLIALYAIISIIRQLFEPKILGKMTGIHPLASLAALFIGLKLMGLFGMFLLPLTLIVLKNLFDEGYLEKGGGGHKSRLR